MFNPSYLTRSTSGIFQLRWPLPKSLHPTGKASTLKLSLKTRDPQKALRLSRPLIQMGVQLCEHGIASGMQYDDLRRILTEHFRQLLNDAKASMSASGPLSVSDRAAYKASLRVARSAIRTDGPLEFMQPDDSNLLARFIEQYGLDIAPGQEAYSWLGKDLKTAYRAFIEAVLAHDKSLKRFDLTSLDTPAVEAPSQIPAPKSADVVSLSELATRYTREREVGGTWAPRTRMEKQEHLNLLKEILGADRDISTIVAKDVARVKDILSRYPKHRNNNERTRGKPLAEALAVPDVECIKLPSINKYLITYGELFKFAYQHSLVPHNYFASASIRQGRARSSTERTAFSKEQIRILLSALLEIGPHMPRKPSRKWGPLIGIYSGARLNEIAQIEVRDIQKEGDIWFFDLNEEGEGKHLKTASSKRKVPVHNELIRLGLLDYVDSLQRTGEQSLFPELGSTRKLNRGRNIGRWFNESLLPNLNLKSNQLTFHSLRHTVVTTLMRAGVQEAITKAVVGHAQEGVTHRNYFKDGYSLTQLKDAIEKLDYHDDERSDDAQQVDT